MTPTPERFDAARPRQSTLAGRLAHVRWIAGGTGAGKSTLATAAGALFDVAVVHGDPAEPGWIARSGPEHPNLYALSRLPQGSFWAGRTPRQAFRATPSVHGETLAHLVADLLAMPADRLILVDYFGVLPCHLASLLSRPRQAVFLVPTAEFRRRVMLDRHGPPDEAGVLAKRLVRDGMWDARVRRQAAGLGMPVLPVDGTRPLADMLGDVAGLLDLGTPRTPPPCRGEDELPGEPTVLPIG